MLRSDYILYCRIYRLLEINTQNINTYLTFLREERRTANNLEAHELVIHTCRKCSHFSLLVEPTCVIKVANLGVLDITFNCPLCIQSIEGIVTKDIHTEGWLVITLDSSHIICHINCLTICLRERVGQLIRSLTFVFRRCISQCRYWSYSRRSLFISLKEECIQIIDYRNCSSYFIACLEGNSNRIIYNHTIDIRHLCTDYHLVFRIRFQSTSLQFKFSRSIRCRSCAIEFHVTRRWTNIITLWIVHFEVFASWVSQFAVKDSNKRSIYRNILRIVSRICLDNAYRTTVLSTELEGKWLLQVILKCSIWVASTCSQGYSIFHTWFETWSRFEAHGMSIILKGDSTLYSRRDCKGFSCFLFVHIPVEWKSQLSRYEYTISNLHLWTIVKHYRRSITFHLQAKVSIRNLIVLYYQSFLLWVVAIRSRFYYISTWFQIPEEIATIVQCISSIRSQFIAILPQLH